MSQKLSALPAGAKVKDTSTAYNGKAIHSLSRPLCCSKGILYR